MKLIELRDYIQSLATNLGHDFVFGNSQRILNRQSSTINYPVVWLEVPIVDRVANGSVKRRYRTAIVVFGQCAVDDWDAQDQTLNDTLEITENILLQMEADSENRLMQDGALHETQPPFEFSRENVGSDEIEQWSADNDWGWRTPFYMDVPICQHIDCCP